MHFALSFLTLLISLHSFGKTPPITQHARLNDDAKVMQVIEEAYFYGYPLVLMEVTKNVMTNVSSVTKDRAPVNQIYTTTQFVDGSFHEVTSPDKDNLYTSAWLDLSKEPLILHLPESKGRYVLFPILDAWTNVIASIGTRTNGDKGGDFAIIGPSWTGEIPSGIQIIRSPTNDAWMIGRIQTNGQKDDAIVNDWQKRVTLTPLSSFGKPYQSPQNEINRTIDMTRSPIDQVAAMDAPTFFNTLNKALARNPPEKDDNLAMLDRFKKYGIQANQTFDLKAFDKSKAKLIVKGYVNAQQLLKRLAKNPTNQVNGWDLIISKAMGNYDSDYMLRAKTAYAGLGANLSADAVYAIAKHDSEQRTLDGSYRYIIHFEKNETPPSNAFWSLNLYDNNFFVPNLVNRYPIHSYDNLEFNPDGSLDILIQKEEPISKKINWLPASDGEFNVILRIFWPKESVLNGKWKPPLIKQIPR